MALVTDIQPPQDEIIRIVNAVPLRSLGQPEKWRKSPMIAAT